MSEQRGMIKRYKYVKENSSIARMTVKELAEYLVKDLNVKNTIGEYFISEREYLDSKNDIVYNSDGLFYRENVHNIDYAYADSVTERVGKRIKQSSFRKLNFRASYLVQILGDKSVKSVATGITDKQCNLFNIVDPIIKVTETLEHITIYFDSRGKELKISYSRVLDNSNLLSTCYVLEFTDYGVSPIEHSETFLDLESHSFISDKEPLNPLEIYHRFQVC